MKKRFFSVLLIPAIIISVLTACNFDKKGQFPFEIDEKVAACFEDCMTVDEIIEDTKTVDLYLEPDFYGLTRETVEDKENGTSDDIYKDKNGNTVYVFHEEYGEDCFDYFTKSASGKDLTVKFENGGDIGRWWAWIKCDDYSITYSHIDKDEKYGAKEIYVSTKKNNGCRVPEVFTVSYQNGQWGSPEAFFCDEEGYEHYCSWEETDNKGRVKTVSDIYPVYTRIEKAPECNYDILFDEGIGFTPEFIFGYHKLSYLEDPDGQWYLTADFILSFYTEEERDAFRTKYGIEDSGSLGNEDDYITLHTGDITIPISKDFEDFEWLVSAWEVDDPYYKAVKFNENLEIISLFSTGAFSLY